MIIIPSADQPDFFAVNVFRVRPETQQQMIDRIRQAGDPAELDGLLSMHLLRSKDGTHVINHMHWAGREQFRRSSDTALIESTRLAIRRFIEGDGPVPYQVIEVKARR